MASFQDEFNNSQDFNSEFENAPDANVLPKARKLNLSKFEHTSIAEPIVNAILDATPEERAGGSRAALDQSVDSMMLGGSGETSGGTQALLDMLQSGAHNVSPSMVGESPTQFSARLKEQGFTGTGPSTSGEMYRSGMAERDALLKQQQEEYPMSSLAGQLGGGLVGAIATGGYGTNALSSKLVGPLLGAKELGFIAAGKQGFKPLLKAVGTEAISSIPMGMTQGALSAEEGGRTKGAAVGALEGSLASVAARSVIEGVPWLAKKGGYLAGDTVGKIFAAPKEFPSTIQKQREYVYNTELRGERVGNEEFARGNSKEAAETGLIDKQALTSKSMRDSESITTKLLENDDIISKAVGQSLKDAVDETGKPLKILLDSQDTRNAYENFKTGFNGYGKNILDGGTAENLNNIFKNNIPLTPQEAHNLKSELYGTLSLMSTDTRFEVRKFAAQTEEFAKSINNTLKTEVPGYGVQSMRLASNRTNTLEPILKRSGVNQLEINDIYRILDQSKYSDDKSKATKKIISTLNEIINDVNRPGVVGESQQIFADLKGTLKDANANEQLLKDKGLIKKTIGEETGHTTSNIINDIDTAATERSSLEVLHKIGSREKESSLKFNPLTDLFSWAKGFYNEGTMNAAALSGRLQHAINTGKLVSPQTQETLNRLKTAIDGNNTVTKNALINTLLQNHTIRNYLNDMIEAPNE